MISDEALRQVAVLEERQRFEYHLPKISETATIHQVFELANYVLTHASARGIKVVTQLKHRTIILYDMTHGAELFQAIQWPEDQYVLHIKRDLLTDIPELRLRVQRQSGDENVFHLLY